MGGGQGSAVYVRWVRCSSVRTLGFDDDEDDDNDNAVLLAGHVIISIAIMIHTHRTDDSITVRASFSTR